MRGKGLTPTKNTYLAALNASHVYQSAPTCCCLKPRSLPDLQLMDETRGRGLDAHEEYVPGGGKDPQKLVYERL